MVIAETVPDERGYFGEYGGRFVPETLITPLAELETAYQTYRSDPSFQQELSNLLHDYAGRPTPLYHASRLSELLGLKIFLKREDLLHTGAHKINNTIGQILLARRMNKARIIAETGAGQHGVATATVAALFGMECVVYMGAEDMERQMLNVHRMRLLGAEVRKVSSGAQTLKDATNEAIRDWVTNIDSTHYIIGSVVGPHPYPMMVRDFQSVIGQETIQQYNEKYGGLPDLAVACVGGGSNAMGLFFPLLAHSSVQLVGVEAAGEGIESGHHSAALSAGHRGVLHGSMNSLLQTPGGQICLPHSISAGLDYPGVGPEHCWLRDTHRARYVSVTDKQALEGFKLLTKQEGIIPALESAHAIAYLPLLAEELNSEACVVLCLSGRGDKDMHTIISALQLEHQQ